MSETLGQRLKKERESLFLTLEKAADETRIRQIFLQALEADDYSVMPSAAQGRGFLRNYAEYLNLNIDEMIADIQKNPPVIEEVSGPLPQVNLVETELPPLTQADEKPAPRFDMAQRIGFLTSWLTRKPKPDASLQVDELAVENQLMEQDQVEVHEEAKKSWLEKIKSRFGFGVKEEEPEANQEIEKDEIIVEEKILSQPADLIFIEIGKQLRERRELISLTIGEVERHTHLRSVFVKALEEGAFDKLPSPVQTRGMLLNYANFLDLDADKILLRFADALQARRREKYAETPRENIQTQVQASIPWLRTFIAGDLIFGVVMISVLVALAIWGVGSLVSAEDEIEPTVIPFVEAFEVESATPTLQSTFVAVDDPSLATTVNENTSQESTPDIDANVVVNLFALERVFVRVSVDGEIAFEGRMVPRESKVFQAENQVVVLTGDGSALRITYNGQDLGLMGGAGEVVNRVYLITGVATPTATLPPTATNTPLVTSTPTFTITPSATPTVSQ